MDEGVMKGFETYIRQSLRYASTVIPLRSGEKYKTVDTMQYLWKELSDKGADRKSAIINVGGGVTGDIGGFAAATYMRGIDYIQIPTTLLSMIDASIGGKVAVNHHKVKNLIGSFQQPKAVIIDTSFLVSLPHKEVQSGFAEMIKYGLTYDREFMKLCEKYLSEHSDLEVDVVQLSKIISQAVNIKHKIVEADPHEESLRKILNFGHTIGHGIESYSFEIGKPLLHGEAVGIGMIAEAAIAEKLGIAQNIRSYIESLITTIGTPTKFHMEDIDAIMKIIQSDKKNISGKVLMSLVDTIGNCKWNIEVSEELVRYGLKEVMG
jgi:3-dehydroquinate synthase